MRLSPSTVGGTPHPDDNQGPLDTNQLGQGHRLGTDLSRSNSALSPPSPLPFPVAPCLTCRLPSHGFASPGPQTNQDAHRVSPLNALQG